MSKYDQLWKFVQASGVPMLKLSFDEVQAAAGIPVDHAFLTFKKGAASRKGGYLPSARR